MYKQMKFEIEGVAPMLMHSGRLADPLDPMTKELKKVSGKRKKTDDDHQEMSKIEWFGALYTDADKRIVIPGECIERMLIDAAKKSRLGREFTSAVLCDGVFPLIYEGPTDLDEMFASGKFTDRRAVRVQNARIMRTRVIFHAWKLKFEANYLPSVIDADKLRAAVELAGQLIGLGNYRPRFGRFIVN